MKDRKRLTIALSVLVVIVLTVGAALAFYAVPRMRGVNSTDASAWAKGVALPPTMEERDDVFRPVSQDAPIPDADILSARLNALLSDSTMANFTGSVHDAMSGKALWDHHADKALQSASVMKLLTAQAALLVLPDEQRVKTETLLLGDGTVVLRGYGDVTLSTARKGEESFYHGAARMSELAKRTKDALKKRGITATKVVVDTSLYKESSMAEGWSSADISGGFIAPMSPVMVDGARLNAGWEDSPRAESPATQAGRALARYLDVDTVTVTSTRTQASTVLGTVWSAPLLTRLHDVLIHSDNVLAEAIGREIAVKEGQPATSHGATTAIRTILEKNDITTSGLKMFDASGLSLRNRVSSHTLVDVLHLSAKKSQSRALLDDLPVSGGSGTLSNRFYDGSSARGWIRAKTGTLSTASSLAGIAVTQNGRVLVFAFIINGEGPSTARPVLDALAATLQACGCQPS